jgi:hypothetical protein
MKRAEMDLLESLNRRHKAALCGTIVCVGLIVLLGGHPHVAVGIGLLGIAYSWALGANRRAVHWLFLVFGLVLLSAPAGDVLTWPKTKADLTNGRTETINRDNEMIETEEKSQHDLASDPNPEVRAAATNREGLKDYHEELLASYKRLQADRDELSRLQAETTLRRAIEDWQPFAGGFLLLCSGLGLLIGVKRQKQST